MGEKLVTKPSVGMLVWWWKDYSTPKKGTAWRSCPSVITLVESDRGTFRVKLFDNFAEDWVITGQNGLYDTHVRECSHERAQQYLEDRKRGIDLKIHKQSLQKDQCEAQLRESCAK